MRAKLLTAGVIATATLLSTSCGAPSGDARPDDKTLRNGINLLINTFSKNHPELVTWDIRAVKKELSATLPTGIDIDAGWLLKWPKSTPGELSQVIVPWTLIGQYPSHPKTYGYKYQGGSLIPQSTINDLTQVIRQAEFMNDQYFAAVLNVRSSTIDPRWIIFTSQPYLPVTDPAYGFATVVNKRWVVVDFGTALVGCVNVPGQVEKEFGFTCP
jgi:hypothetical protein